MPVMNILGLGGSAPAAAFFPTDKFSGSEDGLWYHPQDISSLFTGILKSAGDFATAVDDEVGIMIDKSRLALSTGSVVSDYISGASELLANPNIDSDTSWTKSSGVTYSAGTMVFDGTASAKMDQASIITDQLWYLVVVEVSAYTSGTARVLIGDNAGGQSAYDINGTGTFKFLFTGDITATSELAVEANSTGAFNGAITSVSCKNIPGVHAFCDATGEQGTLKQDGNSIYYILFDGTEYMETVSATTLMSLDSVVLSAFLGRDDTKYSCPWAWNGTSSINFGNDVASTYTQALFEPFITNKYTDGAGDDNTLNIWEVYLDDTDNEFTIDKNDVSEATATATGGGWGTTGSFKIANANNLSQPLECDWYGMIVYEGTAFDQDAYDWIEGEITP